ncbi:MAG: acetyl-CoA carboxylase biotin carboxylase subunit [Halioglobus sp.]
MFQKILIANRGEIACRVIKTARKMGVATVAVYSDADRQALHVTLADEAIHIGASPAKDSYLLGDVILNAAKKCGAQAIHPGYGFLSENAEFAKACEKNGIVFIGPPTAAIESMGSKSAAKRIMEAASVPLVPGYHGAEQHPEILHQAAKEMGYPVLLKATAGGGGKGMRQVWNDEEFEPALAAAKRESMASFGDDTMLVEKYLTKPRHVEIQVFCDNHGNGVYLAERDCSLQRRHQKVIEEAPAPGLTQATREAMGSAALQAANAIDYRGAGTVEFLLDEDGSFFFMEMNTRLQVEHPVTEMITGLDLVEWQLRVANNEPLPLKQDEVRLQGHAMEARVYAEDPNNDFLPATGKLTFLQAPEESVHVRVDTGVRQGDEISVFYDPMIAKLIVWDESRERALSRLTAALSQYRIGGTVTNIEFLYNLATCPAFGKAELTTRFIENNSEHIFNGATASSLDELPLIAFGLLCDTLRADNNVSCLDPYSPWQTKNAWRMNEANLHPVHFRYLGEEHVAMIEQRETEFTVKIGEAETTLSGSLDAERLTIEVNGHRQVATLAMSGLEGTLYLSRRACHFERVMPDTGEHEGDKGDASLRAPMNGTIVTLLANAGSVVNAGTPLLVMEAMKMEHTINAPTDGTLNGYYFAAGDLVDGGAELVDFTADEEAR